MLISRKLASLGVLLPLLALPIGCGKQDQSSNTPSLSAEAGDAYTREETVSIANSLVEELEMPAEKQAKVLKKLQQVIDDPEYRPALNKKIAAHGVTGVIAYRLGEGGAVVTFKSGRAKARLKGQASSSTFKLSGADVGPQLAASREWGIGLVLGLPEGGDVSGTYRGVQRSAGAGAGAGTVSLKPKRGEHEVVFIGAGAGVSLDVSGARLKIKPEK